MGPTSPPIDTDPKTPESKAAREGPTLEVSGLSFAYGRDAKERPALRDVSFTAKPGTITAVVGHNGSGKTTLFRLMLGLLRPSSGEMTIGSRPPGVYRRETGVGYMPESIALPTGWYPEELYRRGIELLGLEGARADEALRRARERASLAGSDRRRLETLSKGMARRCALAYALLGDPGFVLLDEPMSGLDLASRVHLRAIIADARRAGSTLILASHDVGEVERSADQVLVLEEGTLSRVIDQSAPLEQVPKERSLLESLLLKEFE